MQNRIAATIEVIGVPERCRFTSLLDFIKQLPSLLAVAIPANLMSAIVGKDFPSEDDRDRIWYRRDQSGNFIGTYAYQNGNWEPLYNYAPGEVVWMTGDSQNLPKGFELIYTGMAQLPSTTVTTLMAQYVPDLLGGYSYFAALFVGYK